MANEVVVLAAGGTGGHIFPAQALAQELHRRGKRVVLVTDKRFAGYVSHLEHVEVKTIAAGTLSGNLLAKAKGLYCLSLGTWQAIFLLLKLKPQAVVGFGGYPSFPTMAAAMLTFNFTVLHEQNSVLGRANRFLADKVNFIATSFQETTHVPTVARRKTVFTGNPVRDAVKHVRDVSYPALQETLHILVTGGSQGASVFGRVVPEALMLLPEALRKRIVLTQQCREAELEEVKTRFAAHNLPVTLASFFSDIPERLAGTHLVIARSGASTVSELLVSGRPSILVPYPHAMDDHQRYNAASVEEAGAGWVVLEQNFTAEWLAEKLTTCLENPAMLAQMAEAAKQAGQPHAATKLADVVLQTLS